MKVPLVILVAAVALAAAIEGDYETADVAVRICGDDLVAALQEACTKDSVSYLLKYGTINENHKHQKDDNHRHGHDHGHDHDRGHDYSHDHYEHDHSQAEKTDDESISQKCCHKPCLVKEFVAFCE